MNKKDKHILVDVDGVLLSWYKNFLSFMIERGYKPKPNVEDQYELAKHFYNVTEKEVTSLIQELNSSERIAGLPPYKDALEYVLKLRDLGFRFTAITSVSEHPDAKKYRVRNLQTVFGEDLFTEENVICLELKSSKQYILRQWQGQGLFWIEDHFKNAEAGYEEGLKPILIDSPYNRHYQTDLFPRVDENKPWREIFDIITTEYGINQKEAYHVISTVSK